MIESIESEYVSATSRIKSPLTETVAQSSHAMVQTDRNSCVKIYYFINNFSSVTRVISLD